MPDLDQMVKRQRVLADFGEFALRSENLDEILTEACRLVAEALGTGRAKAIEIQHEERCALVRAGVGWQPDIVGELRLPLGDRSSETFSIEAGGPVISRDINQEDRFEVPAFMKEAGVVALANVPIFLPGGQAYGLLQVDSREPRDFGKEDAEFLRTYATLLGPVIDRLHKLRRLRATEERFRLIVENARDYAIFVTDPEDRITDWFPGAAAVFGWTAAEAVGQPGSILFTPEDRERHQDAEEVETARTRGSALNRRWHLRKDGARVFIEGSVMALRDEHGDLRGFLKIGQDVTEQRRTEEQLRESEARFRHMADSAPALIWMTDADSRLVFANMHFDHMFGRPAAEMLGDGWASFVLEEDLEAFEAAFRTAFRARRPFMTETRVRDRTGRIAWLRCEGVPRLDDAGRFLGYTGCNVDITEARLAAEELERRVAERTAELMTAEETLRHAQKMEAVGQLTGGIAHDFNNMLQGVTGGLDMARRRVAEGRAEEALRYLDAVQQAAERAAGLTRRLLAFARRQRLEPRPVNADGLVAGLADLIRRTVGPGVAVELRLRDGPGSVLCDPNELESALLNLCINARDAMPDGGRLAIGTEEVELLAADIEEEAPPGPYVAISVTDTGTGMPPEVLGRVFEPFFTTKPQGEGTGLGLSQVWGFVRQSGGLVRIESAPGRGTTVRLLLPAHGEMEAGGKPTASPPRRAASSRTVLLVDDEDAVRRPAADRLRELGYAVLEARDGPAALRILGAARPDLLVTDVGLPSGMNGRQLAEAVRERVPGLAVLFITGYAGTALPPGAEVIGKPFELDTLARRVQAMFQTGSRLDGARAE
ncbi:PAS domain S-box protein [Falsiroseomonas sp.]|uniref:PAS domain S-box protein n=1 Tax=Falsiroseomonas sp. TaxID=2870721 RepID=UPI00356A79B6